MPKCGTNKGTYDTSMWYQLRYIWYQYMVPIKVHMVPVCGNTDTDQKY